MRQVLPTSKVTTIQQALPQLDHALSTWATPEGGSDYIDQKLRQWFYETTKAWLASGGARAALEKRVATLERLVHDCLSHELRYQATLVGDAKAEAAGKGNNMGPSMVVDILASEPSVRFASAWLKQRSVSAKQRARR